MSEEQKKSTEAWKLKQEEKKKKKQLSKIAESKQEQPEISKGVLEAKVQKKKQPASKKQIEQKGHKDKQPEQATENKIKQHAKLQTVNSVLFHNEAPQNRSYQLQLIFKYLEQLVNPSDTILFLGRSVWKCQIGQQISIPNFNNIKHAEIVCRYSDIPLLMETKITKVICEGDMVFSNGSMLAKKGTLNLVLLAASYNLPIVGCTGSWNYNGWSPFSYEALAAKYGTNTMGNYDWIDSRWLSSLVLEIGTILPPRIYQSLTHVYKKDLTTIPW